MLKQHVEGEDRFTFSFFLRNPELRIERQFNMQRPLAEPSATFLQRLNANVDKVVAKKRKRRKQQVSHNPQLTTMAANLRLKVARQTWEGAQFK